MIKKIALQNIATYHNHVEICPKKINFIYGNNGSGKTTISNLIGNYNSSEECVVETEDSNNANILVYNKKFVEQNFSQSEEGLKGIFTLGEDSIHSLSELKDLREKLQKSRESILTKQNTIESFENEILKETDKIKNRVWNVKKRSGKDFSKALVGYKNSKIKFLDRCIQTYNKYSF